MNCKNCTTSFEVTDSDRQFYERMKVPEPTLCPTCRMQRRLAYRNDRTLYKTKSALSGQPIVTMYDPQNNFVVYDQKEWWGDDWNPMEHGHDFDFNRPFFEQFVELQKVVPRFNVFNLDTENCEYVNYAPHCRNCYLIFGSWFNEDCLYGQTLNECKNCIDNLFLDQSQLCYENIDCNNNFKSAFCQNCSNTTECYFCLDCKNIRNCIGCWNLRNKEFHVLNKPVSKDEFEKIKTKLSSHQGLSEGKQYFWNEIKKQAIHQNYVGLNNENVSGDFIFNCKDVRHCFSVYRSRDVAFCARMFEQKDTYDFEGGGKGELLYENMSNDFSFNSISCTTCEHVTNTHYCDLCFQCNDCLGCVGLRHKQYCIFNKQYTKEEYEELATKMIEHMQSTGEWGEFFPIKLSPFAYNETLAQEYFPLNKEEALKKGYRWKDEDQKDCQEQTFQIPDNIHDVTDQILKEILACKTCQKNYRITNQELKFYQDMELPIPYKCPNCRHHDRMKLRNPRQLWQRKCQKCDVEISTSYAPERLETVYCEECYQKEIY